MRVPLKGLNRVRKRLANGRVKEYYYLGKGGPPVHGEYGSPEFHASYNEAAKSRRPVRKGDLQSLIDRYLESRAFRDLADATKKLYKYQIIKIEKEFGDLPIAALEDRRVRADILDWRDRLGERSPRQADQAFRTLARIISWAVDRGIAPRNPCERAGKLYNVDRRDKVWTPEQQATFLKAAPVHLHLPFLLALWTGQRQGDLLELVWADYDGSHIEVKKQNKTGASVRVPVGKVLKAALDARKAEVTRSMGRAPIEELTILTTTRGTPWTSDGFRTSWSKACEKAGVEDVTFHDLRGTAVTRLAIAGCSIPEIATFTGHSLNHVHSVLERYLKRDSKLADNAMRKLEDEQDSQPGSQPPLGRN
jgi:integrase